MTNRKLSKKHRERLFCQYYAVFLDAVQAAKQAGFQDPQAEGPLLLARPDIQLTLAQLQDQYSFLLKNQAMEGYRRLAFSSAKDAVRLLKTPLGPEDGAGLDLFSVSEIRTSPSGVQIKFADRQKALDRLCELAREMQDPAPPDETLEDRLQQAITRGAEAIAEKDGENPADDE